MTIYRNRTRDLLRIATGGSGVVPPGDLHPDLVNRMATEASRAAKHLLIMAIRAIDYLPPIDINFGDYLRALITSDYDLYPGDSQLYRVAILDAFRQWGIYPQNVRALSIDSLIWNSPEEATLRLDLDIFRKLSNFANGNLDLDRAELFTQHRRVQFQVHEWMRDQFQEKPELAAEWGIDVSLNAPLTIERDNRPEKVQKQMPKFEVHSVRRCRRQGNDGQERVDLLVEVIQRRKGYLDENVQAAADRGEHVELMPDFVFRGGATLIIDPRAGRIRFAIRKSILNKNRLKTMRNFYANHGTALGLRGNYFGKRSGENPFPALHGSED